MRPPAIPNASLLAEAVGELRRFDSEVSLSGDAIAIVNSQLGSYVGYGKSCSL